MMITRTPIARPTASLVPGTEPHAQLRPPTPTRSRRSKFLFGLVVAALVAVVPSPAFAEGSWNSSLQGVGSGFMSRIWLDNGIDNTATRLQISGCTRTDNARFSLHAELMKSVWGPDISLGRRDVSFCAAGVSTVNWGNPGPGEYYLRFWHCDFGLVSARSVSVWY